MIFKCDICGSNFLEKHNECCPNVYKNIINYSKDFNYEEEYNNFNVKKYRLRENYKPHIKVIRQYISAIKSINLNEGTVLDFGCCYGHASHPIKEHSKKIKYIGVDISMPFIINGSKIYKDADFYYRTDCNNDNCLRYIQDNSIDLLVASRLTNWINYKDFLSEFLRVLKKNGHLLIYGNKGSTPNGPYHYQKQYLFYMIKENFFIESEEDLSEKIWGIKDGHIKTKKQITLEQESRPIRFLFKKKDYYKK